MAFLGEAFTTDDLPEGRSYDLIPEGWYTVTITKADLNATKAGNGTKIDMRYDIMGPSQQGRVMFDTINIRNPNAKAEEIGRQQLGEIMRAIGLARVEDTDQLIGASLQIKIKIRQPSEKDKANGYTEDRNAVGGYKAVDGAAAPAPKAAPAASSAPAGNKPPWAK